MFENSKNNLDIMEKDTLPSFCQMEKWITSEICDKNGGIYSWQRGKELGYLYNEITGYGVKLYTCLYDIFKDPKYLQMAKRSVDYLNSQVSSSYGGGISRGGIYYVFDASICLSGILSYHDCMTDNKFIDEKANYLHEKMTKELLNFIYRSLLDKKPINLNGTSPENVDFSHWSLSYGSHLLKCAIAISQSLNVFNNDSEKLDALIDRLCTDMVKNFHNGHFHKNINSREIYTHSHCYATEGLIYLNKPEYLDVIKESANWLASIQNHNGSLYNNYFSSKQQEEVADVTSQAVRIWLWTDREKFSDNIEKGFGFLKSLQSPEGGIYYKTGSKDINSWVTMFTMNDIIWDHNGANAKWLI